MTKTITIRGIDAEGKPFQDSAELPEGATPQAAWDDLVKKGYKPEEWSVQNTASAPKVENPALEDAKTVARVGKTGGKALLQGLANIPAGLSELAKSAVGSIDPMTPIAQLVRKGGQLVGKEVPVQSVGELISGSKLPTVPRAQLVTPEEKAADPYTAAALEGVGGSLVPLSRANAVRSLVPNIVGGATGGMAGELARDEPEGVRLAAALAGSFGGSYGAAKAGQLVNPTVKDVINSGFEGQTAKDYADARSTMARLGSPGDIGEGLTLNPEQAFADPRNLGSLVEAMAASKHAPKLRQQLDTQRLNAPQLMQDMETEIPSRTGMPDSPTWQEAAHEGLQATESARRTLGQERSQVFTDAYAAAQAERKALQKELQRAPQGRVGSLTQQLNRVEAQLKQLEGVMTPAQVQSMQGHVARNQFTNPQEYLSSTLGHAVKLDKSPIEKLYGDVLAKKPVLESKLQTARGELKAQQELVADPGQISKAEHRKLLQQIRAQSKNTSLTAEERDYWSKVESTLNIKDGDKLIPVLDIGAISKSFKEIMPGFSSTSVTAPETSRRVVMQARGLLSKINPAAEKAELAYKQFMEQGGDERKRLIDQIVGKKGLSLHKTESTTALEKLLGERWDSPAKLPDSVKLLNMLEGEHPGIATRLVVGKLKEDFAKPQEIVKGLPKQTAYAEADLIWKDKAKWNTFTKQLELLEQLNGIPKSHLVKTMEWYKEAYARLARRPGQVGPTASDLARTAAGADDAAIREAAAAQSGSQRAGRIFQAFRNWSQRKAFQYLDEHMFTEEGLKKIEEIAKAKALTPKTVALLNSLMALNTTQNNTAEKPAPNPR